MSNVTKSDPVSPPICHPPQCRGASLRPPRHPQMSYLGRRRVPTRGMAGSSVGHVFIRGRPTDPSFPPWADRTHVVVDFSHGAIHKRRRYRNGAKSVVHRKFVVVIVVASSESTVRVSGSTLIFSAAHRLFRVLPFSDLFLSVFTASSPPSVVFPWRFYRRPSFFALVFR